MLRTLVPPFEEPISLDEAYMHLRVDDFEAPNSIEDSLIRAWIGAARESAENFTGLSFSPRTFILSLDGFPSGRCVIPLPRGPLIELISIQMGEGSSSILDPSEYYIDRSDDFAIVVPARTWPHTVHRRPGAVQITYRAGYGDTTYSEPVPWAARAAMLLTIGHLYEHREDVSERQLHSMPGGAEALLRPLRVRFGAA